MDRKATTTTEAPTTTTDTNADATPGTAAGLTNELDADVFEAFDARLEELWMWSESGTLFIGDNRPPSTLVAVTLDGDGLSHEQVDGNELNRRKARIINRPGNDTSPQFD